MPLCHLIVVVLCVVERAIDRTLIDPYKGQTEPRREPGVNHQQLSQLWKVNRRFPTMASSSGNKVNPFELDPYDEWDNEVWGNDQQQQQQEEEEGYAAEDQRLMDEHDHGVGGPQRPPRHKHTALPYPSYDRRSNGGRRRTFPAQGFGSNSDDHHYHHPPQLWKYVSLAVVLVMVLLLWSDKNKERSGDDYISLIDEIPKDEYRLVILGERHSGTSWLQDRLQECYPHASVSSTLQRPGYFFQREPSSEQREEGTKRQSQDTIVLHLTLNVYDWLEQMRSSPEYAPNHVGVHEEGHMVPLAWHEFLLRPWTTERPDRDLPWRNETGPVCQLGFDYDQVVSCVETPMGGTDNPIYELEKGGKPFESIIELRAAKLRNHQSVKDWRHVKKFITVPYETAGKEFKSRILDEIETFAAWKPACSGNVLPPTRERTASMTKEFVKFVTAVTDWEAEAMVSYEPWTDADVEAKGIKDGDVTTEVPKATAAPTSAATEASKPSSMNTTSPVEDKVVDDAATDAKNTTASSTVDFVGENQTIDTVSKNSTETFNDVTAANDTGTDIVAKPGDAISAPNKTATTNETHNGSRWRWR
jgi:hypothetical protein